MIASWPCPDAAQPQTGDRPGGEELAVVIDRGRPARLLILPALFDEQNRLRRFTVETMRALDGAGIDSFLPDWPGTNESLAPQSSQTLAGWSHCAEAAARHFAATHALAVRGGALIAPPLPGWSYAPVGGSAILRQMLRARVLAAREAGREENLESLMATGETEGLELAGYAIGPALFAGLLGAVRAPHLAAISQGDIGGPGLWLRAEPDENAAQSAALAQRIAAELAP